MQKKIVWLPYDFDTAIGINNEGQLVFDYELEDIDHLEGGADVFNGQESVIWKNIRDAFGDDLATMYRNLRSTGALSYAKVEQMFEAHQGKWSEAIFNEDAWFKYIDPLVNDGSGAYLPMLQGSKAEQRKWWLYNRFRYIDSKYNAGDALNDLIQIRGYAKSNITVTPYADIYPTVKYGSYLVSERGKRGTTTTLVCPLDNVNDTEIYIYSASQLASVGDLSGFKVGFADFSMGTKLQSIKIGDSSSGYNNPNLNSLTLGNNVLLGTLDVRNCSALGTGDQKAVDISGCSIVENVYFDGTAIQGVTLPNGGVLKILHLPNTITNLTILNQKNITDLTVAGYSNISTLRIENCPTIDTKAILNAIPASSRVRLIGFYWTATDSDEIQALLNRLDTMRGLDESGNNMDTAQVSGEIHTASLTGTQIASYNERYPYLTVSADHVTSYLTFKTYDGSSTISTITCLDGVPQSAAPSVPARANSSDGHYSYTGIGWNTEMDSQTADANAIKNVIADRTIYAAYTWTVRTYTVTWKNADGSTLETDTNVPWGTIPTYNSATPTYQGETSTGWIPTVTAITGNTTYTATYIPWYTATFVRASEDGGGTLYTAQFQEGSTPVYGGETPTTTQGNSTEFEWTGWTPTLEPIYANTTYTATFQDNRSLTVQYLVRNITTYESTTNTKLSAYAFEAATKLTSIIMPATVIEHYAVQGCFALTTVDLSATSGAVTINANAFIGASKLNAVIIRSETMATLSNVSAFTGTKIAAGFGAIYVPTALVSTYKANTKWSNFTIADINDYPLNDFSTITDTWEEIFANANYSTYYSIGDTKSFTIDGVTHYAQIVGFDEGSSKITWITKDLISKQQMNTSNVTTGGWAESAMRSYLRNTIYPAIQSDIKNHIIAVDKTYYDYDTTSTLTISDTVWIPSAREIFGGSSYEDSGVDYTSYFNSGSNRLIKYDTSGSTSSWWLRSASSGTHFRGVNTDGSVSNYVAAYSRGVALGFCTN